MPPPLLNPEQFRALEQAVNRQLPRHGSRHITHRHLDEALQIIEKACR